MPNPKRSHQRQANYSHPSPEDPGFRQWAATVGFRGVACSLLPDGRLRLENIFGPTKERQAELVYLLPVDEIAQAGDGEESFA